MKTYWDAFNDDYGKDCEGKSLTIILEAFWHYCHQEEKLTRKLLGVRRKRS